TRAHIDPSTRVPFYHRLADAVAAVPGVAHAAGSLITPVSGAGLLNLIDVPGAPPMPERERNAAINFITPGWFTTYGTPIRAGRDIDERDTSAAPPVTLVNEAFARKFFAGQHAIGRTFSFVAGRAGQVVVPKVIVGVAGDAVYRSLRDDVQPTMYVPLAQMDLQFPLTGISLSVRSTTGSPAALAHSVAAALTAVDRDLAFHFLPLADPVAASLMQERLVAALAGFFGALALLLAGLGVYGTTSYSVNRRTTEIGIRMALGSPIGSVVRLVLGRVVGLIAAGVAVG